MPSIILLSNDLFSKWGFEDGREISQWLLEYDDEHTVGFNHPDVPEVKSHELLLKRLIFKYLLPKIDAELKVRYMVNNTHNSFRCFTINDKDLPEDIHYDNDYKPPFSVTVKISEEDVLKEINDVNNTTSDEIEKELHSLNDGWD